MKYERDFAKALPEAWHGKWFEFWDANGHGWCQPDFLLRVGETIVIIEAKYSWVEVGHLQISQLYKPVVEAAYGCKAVGLVVCKNVSASAPKSVPGLEEAIRLAISGKSSVVLHWLAGPPWTESLRRQIGVQAPHAIASL